MGAEKMRDGCIGQKKSSGRKRRSRDELFGLGKECLREGAIRRRDDIMMFRGRTQRDTR